MLMMLDGGFGHKLDFVLGADPGHNFSAHGSRRGWGQQCFVGKRGHQRQRGHTLSTENRGIDIDILESGLYIAR